MLVHPVTVSALLCPIFAYFLCRRLDLLDAINLSMFEAAAFSFGAFLLWLRSRYLATLYLDERQVRKTLFVSNVRRDVAAGVGGSAASHKGNEREQERAPRTVARVAPVQPAFIACCLLLASVYCLMSAILHTIWYVRSDLGEM